MFTSKLKWSCAANTLSNQADNMDKALYIIKLLNRKCGGLHVTCAFNLHVFDKMIMPILCYGCEVWGYEPKTNIEKVHARFCKYILGVWVLR